MQIEQPVIIVGVGRSGSTIFHWMFAEHPNLAWLPYLADRFPTRLALLRAMVRACDAPLAGDLLRKKFGPGEAYQFWEIYCKGFSQPCRDLLGQDVTLRHKRVLPQLFAQLLSGHRHRLLLKITGWPRMGFLAEIFADAKFIHVKRDSRAVINSLINVHFWSGWRGPQGWRCGALTPEQEAVWEHFDRSFIALAGLEVLILLQAMEDASKRIEPGNFLEVGYDAFCADPVGTFRMVADFADLPWSPRFEQRLRTYPVVSADRKWHQDLTEAQQQIVEYFVAESYRLRRNGA